MSGKYSDDTGLNFHDLMADPMIRLIMQADCIDERELREMLERTSADMKKISADRPMTIRQRIDLQRWKLPFSGVVSALCWSTMTARFFCRPTRST
ncbi:hypothetical protein ACFSKM_16425 [Ancylobacter dichloromethanicus]